MKTKLLALVLLIALCIPAADAVQIGQTYDEVVKELGQPESKMQLGDTMILNYAGSRVKLQAGKVVEADAKLRAVTTYKPAAAAPGAGAKLGVWQTDYPSALNQAKASKAKVFLFFTGSDWCGWCKRLDAEVLGTNQFKEFAGENLILVKLDFPRRIPQSPTLQAQNRQLAETFGVRGFPTVVVVNEQGRELGRLGYQPGGPGPFIKQLRKL